MFAAIIYTRLGFVSACSGPGIKHVHVDRCQTIQVHAVDDVTHEKYTMRLACGARK